MNIRIPLTALLFAGFLVIPQPRCQATLASFLCKTMLITGLTAGAVYGVIFALRCLKAKPAAQDRSHMSNRQQSYTPTRRASSSTTTASANNRPTSIPARNNTAATTSRSFSDSPVLQSYVSCLKSMGLDINEAEKNRPTDKQFVALEGKIPASQNIRRPRNSSAHGYSSYQQQEPSFVDNVSHGFNGLAQSVQPAFNNLRQGAVDALNSSNIRPQESPFVDNVAHGFNGLANQVGSAFNNLRRGAANGLQTVADVIHPPTYFQQASRGLRNLFS